MSSLFGLLGYNFNDTAGAVTNYSPEVVDNLSKLPPLLNEWQYEDLRNQDSDVNNYLKNPTKAITQQIVGKVNQILSVSSGIGNLGGISGACLNIVDHTIPGPTEFSPPIFVKGSSTKYIEHCDRLSGLVEPNENTAELPHYDLAIGVGKSLVFLTYQSDGIQNNAPILGSFTSILIGNELELKNTAIIDYPDFISASISCDSFEDSNGNTFIVCTSNLSSQVIAQIQNDLNEINSLFDGRRLHDENYYTNAVALLEKYDEMKRYKDPGQTEKELFVDFIGTERLKSNLP
jgi:hypothetical protein